VPRVPDWLPKGFAGHAASKNFGIDARCKLHDDAILWSPILLKDGPMLTGNEARELVTIWLLVWTFGLQRGNGGVR
jgi:hypothetical protein